MNRLLTTLLALALLAGTGAAMGQSGEQARQEAEMARQEAEQVRVEDLNDRNELVREKVKEAREQLRDASREVSELMNEMKELAPEDRDALYEDLAEASREMQQASKLVALLTNRARTNAPNGFFHRFIADENRGMIGVVLTRDGEDLKIASVTPGSPAEEAGIEAGDVVVAVNGSPVAFSGNDDASRTDNPTLRVTDDTVDVRGDEGVFRTPEGLRGLEVGDRVTLTLSGDKGTRDVEVEAHRRDLSHVFISAPRVPPMAHLDGEIRDKMRNAMKAVQIHFGHGWNRVELAPLNEDLGRYFGREEGVLVISAPDDNPLGLQGGDVILRIGDREPNHPEHAFRIARSFGVGETLEVEVLRDGERRTLTHEIEDEEDLDLGWAPRLAPEAFAYDFEVTAP